MKRVVGTKYTHFKFLVKVVKLHIDSLPAVLSPDTGLFELLAIAHKQIFLKHFAKKVFECYA